jgi:hypothetical protein
VVPASEQNTQSGTSAQPFLTFSAFRSTSKRGELRGLSVDDPVRVHNTVLNAFRRTADRVRELASGAGSEGRAARRPRVRGATEKRH